MRATLEERLNEAEQRIRSPEFRKNSNVGAEFGYYIFTYPAEKELEVRERVEQMKKQIEADVLDFNLYVFDVFEIFIEFLKNKGYLEKSFSFEKKDGFQKLRRVAENLFQGNILSQRVQDCVSCVPGDSVVLLTGIGKIYPLLRSHNILNEFQRSNEKFPLVLFFPGDFTGRRLCLFSELSDENYYRASLLVD